LLALIRQNHKPDHKPDRLERIEQELAELRKDMKLLLHTFKLDGSRSFKDLHIEAKKVLELKELKRRKRGEKIK
jgi:hypothetical protein